MRVCVLIIIGHIASVSVLAKMRLYSGKLSYLPAAAASHNTPAPTELVEIQVKKSIPSRALPVPFLVRMKTQSLLPKNKNQLHFVVMICWCH